MLMNWISTEQIVSFISGQAEAIFLDSALLGENARYSYVGIHPEFTVSGHDNPWPILNQLEREFLDKTATEPGFSGGLMGYLGYECARYLDGAPDGFKVNELYPDYWFGYFPAILVVDHVERKCFLRGVDQNYLKNLLDTWNSLAKFQQPNCNTESGSNLGSPTDTLYPVYQQKIRRIQDYLAQGDAYQINLTEKIIAETQQNLAEIYLKLRNTLPAPYAALVCLGDTQILSASPELLLKIDDSCIETKPIKGTCPRSRDPIELLNSEKDRAELLMIIDLERNDLGKVCQAGSIKVSAFPLLETFSQVHHLVGTVSGKLKPNVSLVSALSQLFPGGSVTGAPKIRAMEIINELEETPRGVYTGALGYLGFGGQAQFNLPIRTMIKKSSRVMIHAGGGIVADSTAEQEFAELQLKAHGLLASL